jgi:dihydroneopterin aldolase
LEDLSLQVRLGCSESERATPQEVRLTVELRFEGAPKAIFSDDLNETICYAKISEALKKRLQSREYKLIEKMAADAFETVYEFSQAQAQIGIAVHKVRPPVEFLKGGSWYKCGDFLL